MLKQIESLQLKLLPPTFLSSHPHPVGWPNVAPVLVACGLPPRAAPPAVFSEPQWPSPPEVVRARAWVEQ